MDRIKIVLDAGGRNKIFNKGDVIFREDEIAYHFYIVKSGKIKAVNISDDGREFIQDFFTDNMSFGHSALFNNGRYTTTAIALVNTEVVSIERSLYYELLRENFDFHYSLTSTLSMRLRMQINKIKSLRFEDAHHRILHLFKRLKNVSADPKSPDLRIDLTRREIAELTGLRTETVIRNIKKMEREGIVRLNNSKIIFQRPLSDP